jgi:hypothetical protein
MPLVNNLIFKKGNKKGEFSKLKPFAKWEAMLKTCWYQGFLCIFWNKICLKYLFKNFRFLTNNPFYVDGNFTKLSNSIYSLSFEIIEMPSGILSNALYEIYSICFLDK